jgi:hypothetical protein
MSRRFVILPRFACVGADVPARDDKAPQGLEAATVTKRPDRNLSPKRSE